MSDERRFKSEQEIFEDQLEIERKSNELLGENKEEEKRNTIKKVIRNYSWEELKERTKLEFNHVKGSSHFHIGTKDKVEGNITILSQEERKRVVLIRVVKKEDQNTGHVFYYHYFFDDPMPQQLKGFVWDTLEEEFYLYEFKTKHKTYKLFSREELGLGEYTIWGTISELTDYVDLGNYTKIATKQPLLFVHSAFKKENQIQSHDEFFDKFKRCKLNEKKLIDWLFTSPQGFIYEFPKSFSYIQIANLLACKDDFDTFHLPILMISETGTGKTTSDDCIFPKLQENYTKPDMTSSTIKSLVPSFKNTSQPNAGLLLNAQRRISLDEFFKGVKKLDQDEKDDFLERIRSILDYVKRNHGSGQGSFNAQMKADCIAYANPKGYGQTILQLSKHFYPEVLCCWLVWYIPKSQKDFIDKRRSKLKRGDYSLMSKDDFLSGLDYLKTFNCSYDIEKLREIYDIGKNFLDSKGDEYDNIKKFYSSRYFVHCCRLLDSLTKFRCWVEEDKSFKSIQKDYDLVKTIWLEMLENWGINYISPTENQKI